MHWLLFLDKRMHNIQNYDCVTLNTKLYDKNMALINIGPNRRFVILKNSFCFVLFITTMQSGFRIFLLFFFLQVCKQKQNAIKIITFSNDKTMDTIVCSAFRYTTDANVSHTHTQQQQQIHKEIRRLRTAMDVRVNGVCPMETSLFTPNIRNLTVNFYWAVMFAKFHLITMPITQD